MRYKQLFQSACKGPWKTIDIERDIEIKHTTVDGELHIYFQGSTSRRDWVINFSFFPPLCDYRLKGKRVLSHRGFAKSMGRSWAYVAKLIRAQKPSKILVCGYSQGAAYAEKMAAIIMAKTGIPVEAVIFGGPPVWWILPGAIRQKLNVRLTRINHRGDIVWIIPHVVGLRGYGIRLKIGRPWRWKFWENHYPANYREALK